MAKSKYALKEVQTLSVTLTRADGPYLVVASTFEPQQLGAYTLTLTAPDDPAVRLEPVPTPGAPYGSEVLAGGGAAQAAFSI